MFVITWLMCGLCVGAAYVIVGEWWWWWGDGTAEFISLLGIMDCGWAFVIPKKSCKA